LKKVSFIKQEHSYILELQEILQELVLQFDDLQIATMNYQKALKLKDGDLIKKIKKLAKENKAYNLM
jgi:hypothetical protein